MDDDIRDRFRAPRRDFSQPASRPQHQPAQPKPPQSPPAEHKLPAPTPRPHDAPHHRPQNPFTAPAHHPQTHTQPKNHPKSHPQPAHRAHSASSPSPAAAQQKSSAQYSPRYEKPVKKTRRGKKWLVALVFLLIFCAFTAGGVLWAYPKYNTKKSHSQNPFSTNIQTSAAFKLFYPAKLPAGYIVDKSTIDFTSGVLKYAAINSSGRRLVFTMQKIAPQFNFNEFYKAQLKDSREITTPYGKAVIGKNSNRNLGSMAVDTTWLLLSTNSSEVTADEMALVFQNLKTY
jgi:hypothetical protein